MLEKELLKDYILRFEYYKELAEGALQQIDDETFFKSPGETANSVAAIVKHIGGNLESRWSDFLESDGEKATRNRDREFIIDENTGREEVMKWWEGGWARLLDTLNELDPEDLTRIVKIRSQEFSVTAAVHRSLAHTSYHVGQITLLARLLHIGEWDWLTIAPNASEEYKPRKVTG